MNVLQKTKVQLCVKRVKDGSDSHVAGRLTGGIVTSPPSCSPCHHLPVYLLFLLLFLKSCTSFSLSLSLHDALSSRSTAFSCLTPPASLSSVALDFLSSLFPSVCLFFFLYFAHPCWFLMSLFQSVPSSFFFFFLSACSRSRLSKMTRNSNLSGIYHTLIPHWTAAPMYHWFSTATFTYKRNL